jgi:squalene synthase HpnC
MKWNFAAQLQRYGPETMPVPVSESLARQYCRWLATNHYENFTVASALLPRQLLPHFHSVYAYCRWSDDLADESGDPARASELLRWWRELLLACYDGHVWHPVFVALKPTIDTFAIPRQPFLDLLQAFEQDQHVTCYDTFEQLLGYCRHSANPVGRLVLYLGRCHNDRSGELSDAICTALQLANFWQDVRRDLDIGRIYLPAEDRKRFGVADADLMARRFTPAFAELMRFEVERTRDLFFRGYPLVERVPDFLQVEVELFVEGGLSILEKIEQIGYNVLERRPVLSKWDKGQLLLGTLWRQFHRYLLPRRGI